MEITEQAFYRWKKKYASLGITEVRRLKQLKEENLKLKLLVDDLSLDKSMLQDVLKKTVSSPHHRTLVQELQVSYGVRKRRACQVLGFNRLFVRRS